MSDHGLRTLALLGSTGSIGTQAINVINAHPGRFRVRALSAGGANIELLAAQARALNVEVVAVASEEARSALKNALGPDHRSVEILAGSDASTIAAGIVANRQLEFLHEVQQAIRNSGGLEASERLAREYADTAIAAIAAVADLRRQTRDQRAMQLRVIGRRADRRLVFTR